MDNKLDNEAVCIGDYLRKLPKEEFIKALSKIPAIEDEKFKLNRILKKEFDEKLLNEFYNNSHK